MLTKAYRHYETIATIRAEELIPKIIEARSQGEGNITLSVDWFHPLISFKVSDFRLTPFLTSTVCYKCGRVGTFFALQRALTKEGDVVKSKWAKWHINLWAAGGYLMTCDHIIPQAVGGTSDPRNLATLCSRCNSRKGKRSVADFLAGSEPFSPVPEGHKNIVAKNDSDILLLQ